MLPVEIWQWILRDAISAPEFLDPDHWVDKLPSWVIQERDDLDYEYYREAEIVRENLRRVCRTWDKYLRQYAHRFVLMSDVVHGKVPVQFLRSALRISFDNHDDGCAICGTKNSLRDRVVNHDRNDGYIYLCRQILEQEQPLNAEILKDNDYLYHVLQGLISPQMFPNLASVFDLGDVIEAESIQTMLSYPSFRHLYMEVQYSTNNILKSSTLTTLILGIQISNQSRISFIRKDIDLPSLVHLDIQYSSYEEPGIYDEPAWLRLLEVVGKGLRTLSLPQERRCRMKMLPKDIWTICPRLEDLRFMGGIPNEPPPEGHPIHAFTVGSNWFTHKNTRKEEWVPDWPGLRTIRMDSSWKFLETWAHRPPTRYDQDLLGSLVLRDKNGESYAEYLSRIEPAS
ncbi:hypothetical protein CPB86DRAFT_778590 [Serendipita vermifera]|nr:hypothetical protein CPB86DRAFT_778590 [Serendipita vermifera]